MVLVLILFYDILTSGMVSGIVLNQLFGSYAMQRNPRQASNTPRRERSLSSGNRIRGKRYDVGLRFGFWTDEQTKMRVRYRATYDCWTFWFGCVAFVPSRLPCHCFQNRLLLSVDSNNIFNRRFGTFRTRNTVLSVTPETFETTNDFFKHIKKNSLLKMALVNVVNMVCCKI